MSNPASQPKHRVTVPTKSALKSGPSKSASTQEPASTSTQANRPKKGPKQPRKSAGNVADVQEALRDAKSLTGSGLAEEGLDDLSDGAEGEDEFDVNGMDVDEESGASDEGSEGDDASTDEEIEGMKSGNKRSKKNTRKRKAATTTDIFASALTSLLDEPATKRPKTTAAGEDEPTADHSKSSKTPVNPILSLSAASALPPSTKEIRLERLAKRQLKQDKLEKKDRARVKDVIEGWGPRNVVVVDHDKKEPVKDEAQKKGKGKGKGKSSLVQEGVEVMAPGGQEWERGLRKVAQRGVIKLFNAILVASNTHSAPLAKDKIDASHKDKKGKKADKDNILGRGAKKDDTLTKEGFLGMLKNA